MGKTGSFTIMRTGDTAVALNVPYTTSGTATAGADYQTLPGIATIPAGASSVVIPLLPIDDCVAEPEETITITLAAQSGYLLGSWNTATASIIDHPCGGTPAPSGGGALYGFSEGSGTVTADSSGNNNSATRTQTLRNKLSRKNASSQIEDLLVQRPGECQCPGCWPRETQTNSRHYDGLRHLLVSTWGDRVLRPELKCT